MSSLLMWILPVSPSPTRMMQRDSGECCLLGGLFSHLEFLIIIFKGTVGKLVALKGNIAFIISVKEQICSLSLKKTLLSSKAIPFKNNLEKILEKKVVNIYIFLPWKCVTILKLCGEFSTILLVLMVEF